ncbi:MAG TPA: 4Fe-4S ferredoxin, partial [Coriobacteriia bacterium]|nr:4Fe-4S ferredoxin [Coriobacteriia bacterium]
MTRYGMLINTKRCVGCYACRLACQMNNSLPAKDSYIRFETHETGTYPEVSTMQIPTQCVHCEDAPCVSVCPTGASHTTAEGAVVVDAERCITCLYCMSACPYGVRIIDDKTGVPEKCRFCVLDEKDDSQPSPACVSTCITGARVFGDIDDPESDVSKAIAQYNAKSVSSATSKTKVFYPEETYGFL